MVPTVPWGHREEHIASLAGMSLRKVFEERSEPADKERSQLAHEFHRLHPPNLHYELYDTQGFRALSVESGCWRLRFSIKPKALGFGAISIQV